MLSSISTTTTPSAALEMASPADVESDNIQIDHVDGTQTQSEYELMGLPNEPSDSIPIAGTETPPESEFQRLPRADGGTDAYLVLAGVFAIESVVWGFPYSFGVFQHYYETHEPFSKDSSSTAAISTTASGLMFLSSPLVALLLQRYPNLRRPSGVVGLVIMLAALVGASFCNSSAALLATQGVLFAVGGLTLYFPAMLMIDEWFIARKGLAFGICWTATGTSGAIVPFLFQWLLDRYGFRTALRVWAVISVSSI